MTLTRTIAARAAENFLNQHVGGFKADADNPSQQADHGMGLLGGHCRYPLFTGTFDRLNLLPNEGETSQVTVQLSKGLGRQRRAFRRS